MNNDKIPKEKTEKQKIGALGENYTCQYLETRGYKIIDRNYLKKWGEIDIVAKKGNKIHFVEVKSVSRLLGGSAGEADSNVIHETSRSLGSIIMNVVRGGRGNKRGSVQEYSDESISLSNKEIHQNNDSYRAEDNMHPWKLQRLARVIQSYLLDKNVSDETEWQLDLVTVHIDINKGLHNVFLIEDIIL